MSLKELSNRQSASFVQCRDTYRMNCTNVSKFQRVTFFLYVGKQDHTVGFRQSDEYQEWKRLLHHFYDPFPTVEHFERHA